MKPLPRQAQRQARGFSITWLVVMAGLTAVIVLVAVMAFYRDKPDPGEPAGDETTAHVPAGTARLSAMASGMLGKLVNQYLAAMEADPSGLNLARVPLGGSMTTSPQRVAGNVNMRWLVKDRTYRAEGRAGNASATPTALKRILPYGSRLYEVVLQSFQTGGGADNTGARYHLPGLVVRNEVVPATLTRPMRVGVVYVLDRDPSLRANGAGEALPVIRGVGSPYLRYRYAKPGAPAASAFGNPWQLNPARAQHVDVTFLDTVDVPATPYDDRYPQDGVLNFSCQAGGESAQNGLGRVILPEALAHPKLGPMVRRLCMAGRDGAHARRVAVEALSQFEQARNGLLAAEVQLAQAYRTLAEKQPADAGPPEVLEALVATGCKKPQVIEPLGAITHETGTGTVRQRLLATNRAGGPTGKSARGVALSACATSLSDAVTEAFKLLRADNELDAHVIVVAGRSNPTDVGAMAARWQRESDLFDARRPQPNMGVWFATGSPVKAGAPLALLIERTPYGVLGQGLAANRHVPAWGAVLARMQAQYQARQALRYHPLLAGS